MNAQQKIQALISLKTSISAIEKGSHSESPSLKEGHDGPTADNESSSFDNPEKAYQKILKVLSYRDRSSHELREKLLSYGFSTEATEQALDRAQRYGLVNDDRFLENQIESKFRSGKGRRLVAREMTKKGFSEEEIRLKLEDSSFSEEDEELRAYEFLLHHRPQGKNLRDSAFSKLVNKGYSINAASKAARKYSENYQNV